MQIVSVDIENYGIIREGSIAFSALPSLVMIAGSTSTAGADSNGAGKSTVFSALTWALFGKELRRRAAIKVVARSASSCSVKVAVTLDDGSHMVVERSRRRSGGVTLRVDGREVSTATGGQELIERRLGFNYDLFTRTIMFGGDISSFCRMTPAQRTQMIEEMLGIAPYLEASERAKADAKLWRNKAADAVARRQVRVNEVRALRDSWWDAVLRLCEAEIREEQARREWSDRYLEASKDLQNVFDDRDQAQAVGEGDIAKYEADLREWRQQVAESEAGLRALREDQNRAHSEHAKVFALYQSASASLKSLESKPKFCPTCAQPLQRASDLSTNIERVRGELRDSKESLDSLTRAKAEADRLVSQAQSAIEALRDEKPLPPSESARLRAAREAVAVARAAMQHVMDDIPGEDTQSADAAEVASRAWSRFWAAWTSVQSDADVAAEAEAKAKVAEYWVEGFGRNGIPSLLLDSVSPSLTRHAKPIADALTDGAYQTNFDNQVSDSGRSDFCFTASNIDGGEEHEDFSKGEMTRIDLVTLFAIRGFMAERAKVKCDQLFIDELFDGLDRTGIEYLVKLLRSHKIAKQIVFISHHESLQEAADAVIRVAKVNGASTIRREA